MNVKSLETEDVWARFHSSNSLKEFFKLTYVMTKWLQTWFQKVYLDVEFMKYHVKCIHKGNKRVLFHNAGNATDKIKEGILKNMSHY